MNGRRRLGLALLLVLSAALAGLAVSEALRDTTPPQLYFEAPAGGRLPDRSVLELHLSADEPVNYTLDYAGETFTAVDFDHVFELPVVAGRHTVAISAVDGAGNRTDAGFELTGVAGPKLTLAAAPQLLSGDPLGVRLTWGPADELDPDEAAAATAAVAAAGILLAGVELPTLPVSSRSLEADGQDLMTGAGIEAVAATPLSVDPVELLLEAVVEDEFGRSTRALQTIVLDPLPFTVEQLRLSNEVLAVVTPEGRELEAATLAAATAQMQSDPVWTDPFQMPITGVFTSGFADARRYVAGGPVSFHNGLDLAAPSGTPVAATNDGTVLVAGTYPIKGGWVMIDHGGGVASHYFHLSSVGVTAGQVVARGEVIGEVGSTGLSTGPHLHWEMRVHGDPTSPTAWVDRTFP